jgi:lipopolysaccharide/colanic/teichoic acid biosynthesis glycosyltransferase
MLSSWRQQSVSVPAFSHHPSATCLIKRSIDIFGAVVGLVILAVIWVPTAIAIKLDSPGPVLYSQKRYGALLNQGMNLQKRKLLHRPPKSPPREAYRQVYNGGL